MLQKIISWSLFGCLIISLLLALAGVTEVTPDKNFYYFFSNVSAKFHDWEEFKIPDIPFIPEATQGGSDVLQVLRNIGNGIITFLNVLVLILNVVISVIKFLVALVWCIVDYINLLSHSVTP